MKHHGKFHGNGEANRKWDKERQVGSRHLLMPKVGTPEAHSGGDKTQRSIVQGTNLALLVLVVVKKTMIKLGPFWCSYFFSVSPETSLQITQPPHNAPFGLMHFGAVPQDAIGTQP